MAVISIGDKSKTFWEIKELISLPKAKVHFSEVGGFGIFEINLGIYTGLDWTR